jgi:1,2-phenylacetyl-CoA epoxidase PaaB subunit
MLLGLFTVKESPRFLASHNKHAQALANLAYLRRRSPEDDVVVKEMAEIEAAIEEERIAREVSICILFCCACGWSSTCE